MTDSQSSVDQAMEDVRPPKRTIRNLWIREVKEVAQDKNVGDEPWYLTLPGSHGIDIQLIIDEGLISLTEVGSIAEDYQDKIIAVERSSRSVADLRKKFIGLKIRQVDFRNLIRGEGRLSWPVGEDILLCRARVINLDLNTTFNAEYRDEELEFPIVTWIEKLSRIHANPPRINWTLLLTLHAEIRWPNGAINFMRRFLRENIEIEEVFSEDCRSFLGDDLFEIATQDINIDLLELPQEYQQKLMMVIVPKSIARRVNSDGWIVDVEHNLRYGGGDYAPMVSWIVKFRWEEESSSTLDAAYRQSLQGVLRNVGLVTDEGELQL